MQLSDVLNHIPPRARAWGKTLVVIGGALAVYVAVALLVTLATGDAIAGAAASNLVVAALALVYRWRSTGRVGAPSPRPRARTGSFWATAAAGLVVCWLAGQVSAVWVYSTWGSAQFDSVNDSRGASSVALVLVTAVLLAPLGEEALMRGIAFTELRKHWAPLASAFVTAAVFSLLHGNVVQIVLTVPLGILLAFVFEAVQRLWPVVVMHVLFNLAASFVPKEFVGSIAQPPMIVALLGAVILVLFALTPGRYAVEQNNEDRASVTPRSR